MTSIQQEKYESLNSVEWKIIRVTICANLVRACVIIWFLQGLMISVLDWHRSQRVQTPVILLR